MKRVIKVILFCLLFYTVQAQKVADWSVLTKQKKGKHSTFTVTVSIMKGYHVYAENDSANGLEKLTIISGDSSMIDFKGENRTQIVYDKVFGKKYKVLTGNVVFDATVQGEMQGSVKLTLKGFAANDSSFIPIEETKEIVLGNNRMNPTTEIALSNLNLQHPLADCGQQRADTKSLWMVFVLGLAGGLIALFTPCVFPMIPLTVSYFIKNQKPINGILYGLYILLSYVLVSVPFHIAGSVHPQIFNTISTDVRVNLAFFILFVLFALSFFGWFEISLPSYFTKAGSGSGVFFMALTLVVVSFSCTGPLLGTLLAGVASNGAWALTAGTAGFGLALGIPFGLFAIFPQWLNKLPKSGRWLDTMKKMLAFIELGFAFKFLSNADLIGQWGILKREIFIIIWILILLSLAVFLFLQQQKGLRVLAVTVLFLAAYVAFDFSGKDMPLLSGFPPPRSYSFFYSKVKVKPAVMNDFDKAIAMAKVQHKPLLIDFTGWACVNCRKMEEQVWSKPAVAGAINEQYILVSLYVDDQQAGEKWAGFEAEYFGQVSQPLYVLLSPDGKLLNHPVGYTPDEHTYSDWLYCGLKAFQND